MKKEDVEKYVKVLKLDPEAKYMLVISKDSGLTPEDCQQLKLDSTFIDEMLMIEGNPYESIRQIEITKGNK
jgi:hypothetical protein